MSAATNDDFVQPASFAFSEANLAEAKKHIAKYPAGRQPSAVLPLLYIAQKQEGWVPRAAMDHIAELLDMAPIRVYEVATFYFMFNTKPVGRYHLQVCTTTPCWLRGSDEVVAAARAFTGIKGWGETSADGLFTMTEVDCLGACVNAPILQVNDDFYEDMDAETTKQLLEALKRNAPPKVGSMKGRQGSAPEGGPVTLLDIKPAE